MTAESQSCCGLRRCGFEPVSTAVIGVTELQCGSIGRMTQRAAVPPLIPHDNEHCCHANFAC